MICTELANGLSGILIHISLDQTPKRYVDCLPEGVTAFGGRDQIEDSPQLLLVTPTRTLMTPSVRGSHSGHAGLRSGQRGVTLMCPAARGPSGRKSVVWKYEQLGRGLISPHPCSGAPRRGPLSVLVLWDWAGVE